MRAQARLREGGAAIMIPRALIGRRNIVMLAYGLRRLAAVEQEQLSFALQRHTWQVPLQRRHAAARPQKGDRHAHAHR